MQRALTIFLCIGFALAIHAQMTPTYIVDIPMRDSLVLAADVYVPNNCNSCPTILIQTPYNKNGFRWGLPMGTGMDIQSSNYSWVVVDWRGFYGSIAAIVPDPKRGEDGYDVIEWIIAQPWNNGKVGTWGPSALGKIQYETMKEHHPAHTCAVPLVAHPQQGYDSYFYGGVLESARLESLDLLGFGVSQLILSNPYYNLTWQLAELLTWYPEEVHIPTLQIGGWYDHNIDKMMDWYEATRLNADISVQDEQWLLVGPWVHGGTGPAYIGSSIQGELNYPNAEFKSDTMALEFFDHYLLNQNNGWENTPLITYYETGLDNWNSSSDVTIGSSADAFLLIGATNVLGMPLPNDGSVTFTSDPSSPSPTIGGQTLSIDLDQGPYDQVSLDSRNDVIGFTTDPIPNDTQISGRPFAKLFVECDQPDADIVVRLVDVYPDGRNMLINDGIHRLRFRNGFSQSDESFMSSGQIYPVDITLPFTNYTWKTGHRIKIFVSGNSSSRWDVNLQNGDSMYVAGDTNLANITIHYGGTNLSGLSLPGDVGSLDVSDPELADDLMIFPNPATDYIFVTGTYASNARYEIININGKVVQSGLVEPVIRTNDLTDGIYILKIQAELRIMKTSFVKL